MRTILFMLGAALGLACPLLVPVARAADAAPRVVLDAPDKATPLVGTVRVAFHVEGVPDSAIARATIALDGQVVATLTAPPWAASIDAGDELRARRLDVRVQLKDGRPVEMRMETPRPPATEIEVRLVNLAVTVSDRSGRPVMDLARGDFTVIDSGQPVQIEHFEASPAPLAVAIVLDMSLSMQGDPLEEAKRSAEMFIRQLAPKDRVGVFTFSDDVRTVMPFASDPVAAANALRPLAASGGTALYDAVHLAATELGKQPADFRRVLLLLSDGRDEASSGLEPGSFHTLDEAVRRTSDVDATVFAIGLGTLLDRDTDFSGRLTTAQVLDRFSVTTGGSLQKVTRWSRLGGAFKDVLEQLRHQYWLGYRPAPPRPGESWRPIRVTVSRPGLTARTREGYFVD